MAKKEKKEDPPTGGCPGWMMTFGDCMSLLLTFFVMILSFTTFDDVKVQEMLGSLNRSLGLLSTDRAAIFSKSMRDILQGQEVGAKQSKESPNLMVLGHKNEDTSKAKTLLLDKAIQEKLRASGMYEMIDIVPLINGVSIRIRNAILFSEESPDLTPEAKQVLSYFMRLFLGLPNEMMIEGHSTDFKTRTARFSSEWELSAARASSVAEFFMSQGILPQRLSVSAMGKAKPLMFPVEEPVNNRVEIILKGLKLGEQPEYATQKET